MERNAPLFWSEKLTIVSCRTRLGDTVVGSAAVSKDGAKVYIGSGDTYLHR